MANAHIRALTARHPIKPTSPRCPSAWQPKPGRRPTYRRGKSVQTTGTTSVVSGRDTSTLLDLVEKPFDQVASAIQIWTETDGVFAIALRWDVGPRPLLAGKLPDPVCVVSAVREQHRLWKHCSEKNRAKPVVVRLTGGEGEATARPLLSTTA